MKRMILATVLMLGVATVPMQAAEIYPPTGVTPYADDQPLPM